MITIVGRGPSLLFLTAADFPDGRVITLNAAIIHVRKLGLPNPIYTMQKDGCVGQDFHGVPVPFACGACPMGDMVMPQPPETLIVSKAESPYCLPGYSPRMVVDVEAFGLPWHTMSAPVAVRIAQSWGETEVLMLGHDAHTTGSTLRVEPDGSLADAPHGGYVNAGAHAAAIAEAAGMTMTWR